MSYEQAAQRLPGAEEARNLLGGPDQTLRGRLRIDVPIALAKALMIPTLPEFIRRNPEIDLMLQVRDQPAEPLADGVTVWSGSAISWSAA